MVELATESRWWDSGHWRTSSSSPAAVTHSSVEGVCVYLIVVGGAVEGDLQREQQVERRSRKKGRQRGYSQPDCGGSSC